jgi:protein-S-isoprenylcysteine O-methyltransferase Ste14
MIYVLFLLIAINIFSYSRFSLFIFNKNVNLSSFSMIFSQTLTLLIWINIGHIILNDSLNSLNTKIGIIVQFCFLVTFWSHIKNSGRTSIETPDEVKITISEFGLYRYIRHPIFSIYIFSYISIFYLFADITGVVLTLFIAFIYIQIGKHRDQQMLNSELSYEYGLYMKKTGVLFPNPIGFFHS